MDKKRYLLIDGIRGLAIVNMVLFHFLYDVYIVYERNPIWYSLPYIRIWQQLICWTFIWIAGFVWQLGLENNFRRGIFFHICGFGISLVTWIAIPTEAIWFGILNFMGCAVIILIPIHKTIQKIPPVIGIIVSFAAFILLKNIQQGYVGIGKHIRLILPEYLYQIKILTPFGFPYEEFISSDYFPIIPWIFLFLTGYFSYSIFAKKNLWKKIASKKIWILSTIGQNSIWIYLLHQPVSMLACILLFTFRQTA